MILLESISFSRFTSAEIYSYAERQQKMLQDLDAEAHMLTVFVERLSEAFESVKEATARSKTRTLSEQIADADRERDIAFMVLRDSLKLEKMKLRYAANEEVDLLLDLLAKYGMSLHNYNYKKQTVAMKGLIERLRTEEQAVAALANLGMEPLLSDMEQAQLFFDNLLEERNSSKAAQEGVVAPAQARRALVEALVQLHSAIATMNVAMPSVEISTLIAHINVLNKEFSARVQQRLTRNENAAADS